MIFELGAESTCVTNLFNRTMPLIRYRFDDILVPVGVPHPRMPFRVVAESIGRSQELITFETGEGNARKMRTIFFDEGVDLSGVKRIQFQKKGAKTLSVCVSLVEEAELMRLSGARSNTAKLEQLIVSIRRHLDDNELTDVKLEVSDSTEHGDEPEGRIIRTGRKEKLVLR